MTLPETYRSQLQHIQESSKFSPTSESGRLAVPFPGYTVITPPSEESESAFYARLQSYQQQLLSQPDSNFIVPVPPASFHMTIADLIWDNAYRDACEKNPNFEEQLRFYFSEIFQQYQQSLTSKSPIRWQMLGIIVMPRAIGVGLVPTDEASYEQIVNLRRAIYQNSKLIALGIEQHYHFTSHITLGYFGEISPTLDRDRLCDLLSELNQQWLLNNPPELVVSCAQLRKFDDMTRYHREPEWAVLNF